MSRGHDKNESGLDGDHVLPPHGGYRKLRSFQIAECVYDGTVNFCDRFVDSRSRTHDQMEQAARSGRQNIAEGSEASATSKKMELKLTNTAKASLEELLLDFEDYLRQHSLRLWAKESPEALAVRRSYQSDKSDKSDPYRIRAATAEVAANTMICLINQATYLLKRQIERLERDFLERGGITERLYHARTRFRDLRAADEADKQGPAYPHCGKGMVKRTARKGPRAGKPFWGCVSYPDCTGTRPYEAE